MITLRPYQQSGVDAIRRSYASGRRAPLFVLPCGGGKSIVLSYVAAGSASKGRRVIIQAHRVELIRQLSASLDKVGVEHGIIAAGYDENLRPLVQLASVDTLARRIDRVPEPHLVITDEAHHLLRKNKWGRIVERYSNARLLGVTATPQRLSGHGLGVQADGFFDDLIVGPSVEELTAMGALVPMRVFAPQTVDMTGVHTVAGDYNAGEAASAVDKPSITGDAIAHYRKICDGARAIVFAASVEHSMHVAASFRAAGIMARHVDGGTDSYERAHAMREFRNGSVTILTNCELFTEGVDCPALEAVIMLRPTQSLSLYTQMWGRASRPADGKQAGYLLDCVGNVMRHGMPDEPQEWTLAGRERRQRSNDSADRLRVCKQCYAANPIGAVACRECGAAFPVVARVLEQRDGELVEITQRQEAHRQARREEAQARTLEDWQRIGRARGYQPSWARIRYQLRVKRA